MNVSQLSAFHAVMTSSTLTEAAERLGRGVVTEAWVGHPRTRLGAGDDSRTLSEAGLSPNGVVHVRVLDEEPSCQVERS